MADIESNINLNIETSEALANIKRLQAQISAFHQSMSKGSATANAELGKLQQNLVNSINATGAFSASVKNIATSTETFTKALETNKLSMGQYFKYSASQMVGMRKLFSTEFDTIEKVARERVKTLQTQYVKLGRDANGAMKSIAIRPLVLDMEDLGTKTAIAAQKQQIFNQLIKQGSTNLLNFGKNTQWAGRQLMVGFTVPLGIAATAAGREFMKMEEQVIRFQRVYGDFTTSAKQTDEMVQSLRDLSSEFTKYGVAVEKTMGLAADAAAMGKQGKDLLDQVTEATRLSVLGGVDQQQALETTTSLTNAFGIASDKLAGKINFLNAVENQTVTSIEDLTTAIPTAAPVIQQLGGDVEDLAFFMTAMKEGGINASEGANALKSGLASMINPTTQATEMLNGFGINLDAIVKSNAGNVKNMVIELGKALDGLSSMDRARAIEQVFGKFQFARMSTLFQNVIKEGSQAQRVLEITSATTEELAVLSERELKRVEDSPMYKFKGAMEDFKASLIPVGEEFVKAVTPIIEFGTKILDKFNEMGDGAKNFTVIATTLVAGIGPVLLMTFGLIANGVANIIKGFQAVGGFFARTSGQSRVLGESTDYMTQQQLEAAAVAASLNQVHQDLIQTFTSEAWAVNELTAALTAAAAAQARMPGAVAGRAAKKFATGGIVPGSGNSDTVPAMLTPGEAVIPKDKVRQYGPMISGMIAGNIPGYNQGLIDAAVAKTSAGSAPSVEGFLSKQFAKVAATGNAQLAAEFEAFVKNFVENTEKITRKGLADAMKAEEQLVSQFNKNLVQQGKSQFAHAGEMGNMTASQLAQSATITTARGSDNLERLLKILPDAIVRPRSGFGFDIAGDVNNALGGKRGAGAAAMQGAYGAIGSEKWATAVKIGGGDFDNLKAQVDLFDAEMAKGIDKAIGNGAQIFYDLESQIDEAQARALAAGEKFDRSLYASMENITKQSLTNIQGVGDELIQVFRVAEQTITEVRGTLTQAEKALLMQADPDLWTKMSGRSGSGDFTLLNASSSRFRTEGGAGKIDTAKAKAAGVTSSTTITDAFEQGIEQGAKTAAEIASPSRVMERVGAMLSQGAKKGLESGIDDATAAGAKLSQAFAYAAQNPLVGEGPLLPGQTRKTASSGAMGKLKGMMKPGKIAGAGMAAMGVASMASMVPGPIGETAQGLMGPLMGLTAILPILTNKFGAIALLLAAIPAAIIAMNVAFDNAQKSAMKLTESTNAGEKSIRSLAEAAGKASAGEVMDKRRQGAREQFAVQSGKGTFGEAYIQSEAGKALMDSIGKSVKDLGKDGTIAALASQLSTGVASGALDPAQAKSIAANLGMELGDYNFGIKINGEIDKLIGPNGENLAKDPLTVRMNLIEDTRTRMNQASGRGLANAAEIKGTDVAQIGGGIAAGAGVGAAAGAGVGSVVPIIGNAVGAIAGTIIGGVTGGIVGSIQRSDRIAKASGAAVALNKVALQQHQEMLDSLDLQYEKQIANARALGDMARVSELENKHLQDRNALLEKGKQLMSDIAGNFSAQNADVQGAMTSGVIKSIESQYKGTPMEDVAGLAKNSIVDANLNQAQEFTLLTKLDTGDISPTDLIDLMDTFKSQEDLTKVMDLVMNMDSKQFDDVVYLTNQFDNESVRKEFVANFQAMVNDKNVTPDQIQKYIDTFMEVQKLDSVIDVSASMEYLVKNPDQLASLQSDIEKIKNTPDITLDVIANSYGGPELDALLASADTFAGMSEQTQKDFVTTVTTIYKTIGTPEFAGQYKNAQAAGFKGTKEQYGVELAKKTAAEAARARNAAKQAAYEESQANASGGGGGGGTVQKVKTLDSLLAKLKQVRSATTAFTEGWNESRTALDGMFGAGISGFNGLEQQMRKFGARQDLISLIAGMDPAEYERRKDELFTFDAAGNLTGFRQSLVAIADAMRAIVLGDFQNKQQTTIQQINDQQVAVRKLVNAGMSYSDAYAAVQDTAFASAVAMEKNNQVIKDTIKDAEAAATAVKNLAAAQAVAGKTQETADQGKLLEFLSKNAGKLTNAQTQAILGDKNLQTLALSPNFDPNTFQDALDNVAKQTELDLEIKKLTIDGMDSIFQDGFSKAMDAFSAEEQKIKLKFDVEKKPLLDAIKNAQEQIGTLQDGPGGLDDLDAELQRISWKEDDINKKYKKRIDALTAVQKVNDQIVRQQKAQISIADALTQGDIAAAARAMQELRAQNAQDSAQNQQAALERAQQAELNAVVGATGKTRQQVEDAILAIKQRIFDIEESTIEPAQYRVTLLDQEQQRQTENLTVLGRTRAEWETIKNDIDVARVNSDSYKKSIEDALGVVQDIEDYWNNIDGKEVSIDVVVRQTGDVTTPTMAPVSGAVGPAAEEVTGGGGGGGGGAAAPVYEDVPTYDPSLDNVEGKGKKPIEPPPGWPETEGWWQSLMAMGSILSDAWGVIANWWNTEGPGKYINEWMAAFGAWWDQWVTKPVKDFINGIATWWNEGPGAFFNTVFTAIGQFWDTYIAKPIASFFDWFFGASSVEQKKKDIMNFVGSVGQFFANMFKGVADWIGKIPGFFNNAVNGAIGFLQRIWNWFTGLPGVIGNALSGLANNIGTGIRAALNQMFNTMRGVSILGWKPFAGLPQLAKGGQIPGQGNKDNYPAMLMPGEYVITKDMVNKYGVDMFDSINKGAFGANNLKAPAYNYGPSLAVQEGSSPVYNNTYSINVNVKSDANADDIARSVMMQIKQVDAQRIRSNRF